jgi:hypothetical protein
LIIAPCFAANLRAHIGLILQLQKSNRLKTKMPRAPFHHIDVYRMVFLIAIALAKKLKQDISQHIHLLKSIWNPRCFAVGLNCMPSRGKVDARRCNQTLYGIYSRYGVPVSFPESCCGGGVCDKNVHPCWSPSVANTTRHTCRAARLGKRFAKSTWCFRAQHRASSPPKHGVKPGMTSGLLTSCALLVHGAFLDRPLLQDVDVEVRQATLASHLGGLQKTWTTMMKHR